MHLFQIEARFVMFVLGLARQERGPSPPQARILFEEVEAFRAMPIYEYFCEDCGEKYDKFVRSSLAKVELECPKCGSARGKKAFSVFGVRGDTAGSSVAASTSAAACGPIG
jgi:putative FmdB family regulatory protein